MSKNVMLPKRQVAEDVFDDILVKFAKHVVRVDSLDPYLSGYKSKRTIYYDESKEQLICRMFLFETDGDDRADWLQCVVVKDKSMASGTITKDISGSTAYNKMMKLLLEFYTREEIYEIFNAHTHTKCGALHYTPAKMMDNTVIKYSNCHKYDINSAYASVYIKMFPRAAKAIENIYLMRKENPVYKKMLNYFVGMIKHKGFDGTYYYIVNYVNELMKKTMSECGGMKLYINTDGFIVCDPAKPLEGSKDIGKFKEEYSGDVYVYHDKNYFVIQTGYKNGKPDLTGSCFTVIRDKMDLEKGIVVHYDRKKTLIYGDAYLYKPDNIRMEVVEII